MVLKLADWVLDVDISLTMEISAAQAKDHCECGYCRNFYRTIDKTCPTLRVFMARLGVDVEAPDELCPFEPTVYEVTYIVQGEILQKGTQQLLVDNTPLTIRTSGESDIETEHPLPFFTVTIGLLELPWVLSEPMCDVISPANEPEYLQRMERKLLDRFGSDSVVS